MQNNIVNFNDHGFLLTRKVHDTARGLVINLWLKTANGAVNLIVENEQALFFVEIKQVEQAKALLIEQHKTFNKVTKLNLKTFNQQQVSGFYFTRLSDFYAAREILTSANIKCYEDDIRPDDRYLMERFITANFAFTGYEPPLKKSLFTKISQVKCKAQPLDNVHEVTLTLVSIDIECSMAGDLYSIAAYSDDVNAGRSQVVFMIGDKQPTSLDYIVWVNNEVELITEFITWLNDFDPDIIIGWNVINFDLQLLQKRCDLHHISFAIGRDGKPPYWRKNKNSEQIFIEIAGRVVLDGIDLLKTATYSFPSFSLDNVANTLLGIGKKVEDIANSTPESRIEEITNNFHHNKSALAEYNLEDCRLVWLIFEKTDLLAFAMLRAQLTGLAIDRIGGSVGAFTNLYLPKLHRAGYVAPNMGDGESDLISPGGYVMDSIPGLYDNVLVLDFKSLYPSIIRTFSIDPMGLIEGLLEYKETEQCKDKNAPVAGFDGAYFSRAKHFLPDIIRTLWAERDKAKLEKNAALSQAIKIIMNSFYGILGSTGCRFFDPRLSGSITKRSHQILINTKTWLEQQGLQVIYGDTDSIFVHIGKEHDKQSSLALGKKLQDNINHYWTKKLADDFYIDSELEIEFETHFTRFLMPTIRGSEMGTKKRYAGLVVNTCSSGNANEKGEQQRNQKIIFKGLESVRTDWTELAKLFQRELYHRVFNDLPVKEYILEIVEKTKAGEFDQQLIYRKRLRRKLSHYVKNVPPQVKAARFADELNAQQDKALKYQNRGWIEYYITLNGPQAKEYLSAPLDYQFYIDRQLEAVADGILPFIGTSFIEITDSQMGLF
ncbi:MAG: DNA polymerase II [Gammaproteobacteria bacterium]|nr:MAG: DNA polymerase II [Gammaproteobacteria bacterium]